MYINKNRKKHTGTPTPRSALPYSGTKALFPAPSPLSKWWAKMVMTWMDTPKSGFWARENENPPPKQCFHWHRWSKPDFRVSILVTTLPKNSKNPGAFLLRNTMIKMSSFCVNNGLRLPENKGGCKLLKKNLQKHPFTVCHVTKCIMMIGVFCPACHFENEEAPGNEVALYSSIAHFRGDPSLFLILNRVPSAKPFIRKWVFFPHANKTYIHINGYALGLGLKWGQIECQV